MDKIKARRSKRKAKAKSTWQYQSKMINIKTKSIRKLSNCNFQWTKTLSQNSLNNIAFFFTLFKGFRCNQLSVITPKKISCVSPRKEMSNFTKWHLTHEIFRILPAFSQFLWNLTFILSDSHEKFSLVLSQKTNYIFRPWKL